MDRFADDGKLGQGFTSADDLAEVDIGNGDRLRLTFISAKLDFECKQQLTDLLRNIKIALLGIIPRCLVWTDLLSNKLPIKPDFGRISSQLADVILIFFLILSPK